MTRVAINGFGRIGRCVLRALYERANSGIQLVAINELADASSMAYLTRFDSTHGRFSRDVALEGETLCIGGDRIRLCHEADPQQLPWAEEKIDILIECSGAYSDRLTAERHIAAGASKVLFSQPADADVDATIVFGVNEQDLRSEMQIVSAASCTTNCAAPVLAALSDTFGLSSVMIRTLHAAMNDQPVLDAYHHADLRRNRAAFESIIPVETELARGIDRVLPGLKAHVAASALRLPISDVSAMDMDLVFDREVALEEVIQTLELAAESRFNGVLGCTLEPLVSRDFVHDSRSAVVDMQQLRMAGPKHLKMLAWFDNEWGYANRVIDIAQYWAAL